jgi:hypothetical protein
MRLQFLLARRLLRQMVAKLRLPLRILTKTRKRRSTSRPIHGEATRRANDSHGLLGFCVRRLLGDRRT